MYEEYEIAFVILVGYDYGERNAGSALRISRENK